MPSGVPGPPTRLMKHAKKNRVVVSPLQASSRGNELLFKATGITFPGKKPGMLRSTLLSHSNRRTAKDGFAGHNGGPAMASKTAAFKARRVHRTAVMTGPFPATITEYEAAQEQNGNTLYRS